jgi:hypothetical protein
VAGYTAGVGLARFELNLTPGDEKVVIDGVDVSHEVTAVHLQAAAGTGRVPLLVLELAGTGTVAGEGLLEVTRQLPDGEAVATFLEALDAETLEKEVTAGLGWGAESNYTRALLARLAELARGPA